jgi:hypothetical protein
LEVACRRDIHLRDQLQLILIRDIRMHHRDIHHRLFGPVVLVTAGVGLVLLASTQSAWRGERIGPGLVAQAMAAGTVVLALVWAVQRWRGVDPPPKEIVCRGGGPASGAAGLWLLGAVAAFALLQPHVGLVPAAGATALAAAVGCGARRPGVLAAITAVGALIATAIGLGLLGAAAVLWSWPGSR